MAIRKHLKNLRQAAADPFNTKGADYYYDDPIEDERGGRQNMEERTPKHRNGDPRGPQYTIGTDYSESALVRAEFTYADGHKVAFKHEEMIPANKDWIDAVGTLPPTVATRRFWLHELDSVEHGCFLTDEDMLSFANRGKTGKDVYTDVKRAAADLRFNVAWLEVDESNEPVRLENGQFIVVDLDPVYEARQPARRRKAEDAYD